ncbi:hypothetical protein Q5P01_018326 [Channa striata]|uniref:Uncharacterized protein n=1 Tax=Channa striata TaxID=64152 RepID=A0AA88M471_CHASR|nr:hypothetical protein Q5P01_018326 [Channa striata]
MEVSRRLNWIRNRPWRPYAHRREFNQSFVFGKARITVRLLRKNDFESGFMIEKHRKR